MRPSKMDPIKPVLPLEGCTLSRRRLLGGSILATAVLAIGCSASTVGMANDVSAASQSTPASATPTPALPVATPTSSSLSVATIVPSATAPTQTQAPAQALAPTSSSTDPEDVTPALTEGPYFKANSPERTSLVDANTPGTRLTLTGRVLATSGQPVAKALLDFWQANASGAYDNAGYTLRGHQLANANGQYQLVTVIPGLYTGRTRHIHVKVQAPNGPVLTTQLFFPSEPLNSSDSIFNPKLVLPIKDGADGGKVASFDFVINLT
jgi:protocatechuate 3,4-dioxygenase beta subunit